MAKRKSSLKISHRRTKRCARTRRPESSPARDAGALLKSDSEAKPDAPSKRVVIRTVSEVLTLFDEALMFVATAASAIEGALDSTVDEDAAERTEKVECLVRGVKGLRTARIEIAVALYERDMTER